MSLTDDLLTIVGSPQWNFVYYVLALLALEVALALAFGHWKRSRQLDARRLLIGSAALLLTRLFPLFLSLAPGLDSSAPGLLPPLERALDTIAIALIGWMLLAPAGAVWSAPFIWLNLGLVVLADVALTRLWMQDLAANPALSYAMSWQRYVWAGWQIALCLFLGYLALRGQRYTRQAGYLVSLFAILLIGQALELVVPVTPALFPIWERLTAFIAAGLLAFVVYQIALAEARQPANAPLPPLPHAGDLTETLLALLDDARVLTAKTGDQTDAPIAEGEIANRAARVISQDRANLPLEDAPITLPVRAARIIAHALGAEQVAIGLLEGTQEDRMHLAAVFNPRRRGRGGVVSFPLDEQLAIRRALRRRELVQADGAEDVIQIKFLYALMGSEETGPIMIQPLVYRERLVGAIIAGNGATKRPFSDAAARLVPLLGEVTALLVMAPRTAQILEEKLRQSQQATTERETEWDRRLDILGNELQHERESAQLFGQRMTELEREGQQKQTEMERLQRRLTQQEEETRRSQQEAIALSKKLESLTLAKVVLEDEVQGYRDQIQNLEHLLAEGQQERGRE